MRAPTVLLVAGLIFLGVGGLYGGGAMLADPTGRLLGMASVRPRLLVPSFVLPGLFLIVAMGIAPLALAAAWLARRWPQKVWTATLLWTLLLDGWLLLQVALIGLKWPMQWIAGGANTLVQLCLIAPSLRRTMRP